MAVKRYTIAVTTDASGDATVYSPGIDPGGEIVQISYKPAASSPLDTGADIVVTDEFTAAAIVTKANIGTSAFSLAPRQATHAVADGAALVYAAGGAPVADRIAIGPSRVKIVVAQGGNVCSGTFYVYVA